MQLLNLSDTAATTQDGWSLEFIAAIAGRQCYNQDASGRGLCHMLHVRCHVSCDTCQVSEGMEKIVPMSQQCCKILLCFVEKVRTVSILCFLVAFLAHLRTLSLLGRLRCFVLNYICRSLHTFWVKYLVFMLKNWIFSCLGVRCQVSYVICHVTFFLAMELVGGGFVMNRA